MLTILGGHWRGRRLKAIEREGLRPSSSRVKASIFSILEAIQWKRAGSPDFEGWKCADLFAGVGGLGLEILSRGAQSCCFVEKERPQFKVLKENIQSLGCENQTHSIQGDVNLFSWVSEAPFDLILMDPPYAQSNVHSLLNELVAKNVLVTNGIVLIEHDPKIRFEEIQGLEKHSERILGPAGITVFFRNT
jgi:16S rRNA (guanine966-N2)-methyltransferase